MSTRAERTIRSLASLGGDTYGIGPEWVTLKVPGSETEGEYLVIEVTTPPGGGPPLHTHPASEVFFVTAGEFEFPTLRDGEPHVVAAAAGEVVHIPGGVPHTYRNIGDSHGRLIGILTPAGEMEGFFREGGVPIADSDALPTLDIQPDMERLMAACQKYNLTFLI